VRVRFPEENENDQENEGLSREIVEGEAGEEVGDEATGGVPVAREVGVADDADAFHGAEVLEVGDRDGIGGRLSNHSVV